MPFRVIIEHNGNEICEPIGEPEIQTLSLEDAVEIFETVGRIKKDYTYLAKAIRSNEQLAEKIEEIIEMMEISTPDELIDAFEKYAVMGFVE